MNAPRLIPVLLIILATSISLLPSGHALAQGAGGLPTAAPDAPFSSQARQYSIAQFEGRKVMLWLLSTWCPSCSVGMQALVESFGWGLQGFIATHQSELFLAAIALLVFALYQNSRRVHAGVACVGVHGTRSVAGAKRLPDPLDNA